VKIPALLASPFHVEWLESTLITDRKWSNLGGRHCLFQITIVYAQMASRSLHAHFDSSAWYNGCYCSWNKK